MQKIFRQECQRLGKNKRNQRTRKEQETQTRKACLLKRNAQIREIEKKTEKGMKKLPRKEREHTI